MRKLNKFQVLIIITTLPYLNISYSTLIGYEISSFILFSKFIIGCCSIVYILSIFKKLSLGSQKILILFVLYYLTIVISSICNNIFGLGVIIKFIINVGFICYIIICVQQKNLYITAMYYLLWILVIGSIILELFFPTQIYKDSYSKNAFIGLFGNKNGVQFIMIPAIIISLIFSKIYNKRFSPYILIITSTLLILLSTSSTAIVAAICLFFVLFFGKKINVWVFGLGYIYIFYSIIWINRLPKFIYNLTEMMGKDITFTGRRELWDNAVNLFYNSVLIGYGSGETLLNKYNYQFASHNGILQILIEVGIIGLIIFLFIVIYSIQRVNVCKRGNKIAIYLIAFFISTIIISTTENAFSEINPFLFIFIILGIHIYDFRKLMIR